jgi:hypothetical protein
MYGEEVRGICRLLFQLLAELEDVIVHRARAWIILITPDLVQ